MDAPLAKHDAMSDSQEKIAESVVERNLSGTAVAAHISAETSQRIKNMGLLCACLVVGIHVNWYPDSGNACWFLHHVFRRGVCLIAVPFFFVVSGFFLAQHFEEAHWWGSAVKKRIKSLEVPFYCWTALYIMMSAPFAIIADHVAGRSFGTNLIWMHDWVWTLGLDFTRATMTPLWYLRCLFVFVVLSVAFKFLVLKLKWVFLIGLAILGLGCEYMPKCFLYDILTEGILPNCGPALGAFYFSLGMLIQTEHLRLRSTRWLSILNLIGVALLVVGICYATDDHLGQVMLLLAVGLSMFLVYCNMPSAKWPSWLTGLSFPIYLVHGPVIFYLDMVVKRLPLSNLLQAIIVYMGAVLGSVTISLLLKKFTPGFARVVFGGR